MVIAVLFLSIVCLGIGGLGLTARIKHSMLIAKIR